MVCERTDVRLLIIFSLSLGCISLVNAEPFFSRNSPTSIAAEQHDNETSDLSFFEKLEDAWEELSATGTYIFHKVKTHLRQAYKNFALKKLSYISAPWAFFPVLLLVLFFFMRKKQKGTKL